jgi:hypothetical protein
MPERRIRASLKKAHEMDLVSTDVSTSRFLYSIPLNLAILRSDLYIFSRRPLL